MTIPTSKLAGRLQKQGQTVEKALTHTTYGGWTERGCISQLCVSQPDESRQHRAFLRLPAPISPSAPKKRRATAVPTFLKAFFQSSWKYKTALKVSSGLEEQQCKCVAQRPTWQTRTYSSDVINARLKQTLHSRSLTDKQRLIWNQCCCHRRLSDFFQDYFIKPR